MKKSRKQGKMASIEAHTAIKTGWVMVMSIFFTLFLVGTVSAFEFDNKLTYSDEDLKVDFDNLWGLGKYYGSAKLESHPSVNYIKKVGAGNQVVMWYDFNFIDLYLNGLGEVEFTDMRTGEEIDRDYSFVYWGERERDVYGKGECSFNINGTQTCETIVVGKETYETWLPYNSKDIPKGDIRIGLMTSVEINDKVDGVWTIIGKKVSRHSAWTQSLNVGLVSYYKLDEQDITGSGTIFDSLGINNGTNAGADNTTGKIKTAYDFELGNTDYIDLNAVVLPLGANANFTICMWINPESKLADANILSQNTGGAGRLGLGASGTSTYFPYLFFGGVKVTGTTAMNLGTWYFVCGRRESGTISIWVNGVSEDTDTQTAAIDNTDTIIGAGGAGASLHFDGDGDEVGIWNRSLSSTEIGVQLWNDGGGISFTEIFFQMIINAPANNSFFDAANVTFNATVTSVETITNVTLIIDGSVNESNTSEIQGIYLFEKNLSDGIHTWNINATNGLPSSISSTTRTFTIDTIIPLIDINSPIGRQTTIKIGNNETVTWNITDINLDTCLLEYNGANTTLNCTANTFDFLYVDGVNTLSIFANDTVGNSALNTTTWDYNFLEKTNNFNVSALETATQSYAVNITLNDDFSEAPTSVRLFYAGTEIIGTATLIDNNNYTLSKTIDVPTGVTTNSFFFSFNVNSTNFNTSSLDQEINETLFLLCNATHSTQFINFTFRNETTNQELVSATINSIWVYYLGTGIQNKTLSFSNSTENNNYIFCLNVPNERLSTTLSMNYNNDISQQRIFEPSLLFLTNITDSRTLFLLPTNLGLFSQFRTEDNLGNTLVGTSALITRVLNGDTVIISSDSTDGSGLVVFFLNPDATYTALFSLTGFIDNTFSFVPITDLRTIVMGSITAVEGGSNISLGMNYTIEPTNTTLNNGTTVTFRFNVSSIETITFMGMDISDGTTTFLLVNKTGDGSISGALNTRNNKSFIGTFTISTTNETITLTKIWRIERGFIGDYSIFRQFVLFNDYDFKDFIRLLIVIATLAAVMILMSKEIGIDEEVKMVVVILIVWAFSIVGWLDTGIILSTDSQNINNLAQFSNQYGIAIISTVAASYFILRRVFRQI